MRAWKHMVSTGGGLRTHQSPCTFSILPEVEARYSTKTVETRRMLTWYFTIWSDYVLNKDDFRIEGGTMGALPKPGLGVEIDEERVLPRQPQRARLAQPGMATCGRQRCRVVSPPTRRPPRAFLKAWATRRTSAR